VSETKLRPALSVLIPAFDEEAGIRAALGALAQEPRLAGAQVVVIDDGSADATAQIAESFPSVSVVRHERNRGYGAAIKTGLRSATGRLVAWYDADGQHSAADLADMVAELERGSYDAVLGARGPASHSAPERLVGKFLLKLAAQGTAGRAIPDINCGLRVFRREVLARYAHLLPDGFSASTTTTLLMLKRPYRVRFHTVTAVRRAGHSSVRQVRDGLATLHLIARVVMLFNAFRVFSAIALALGLVGVVYGTLVAVRQGLGFPVLAAVLIIVALQVFLMGLIGDQISALRLERLEERSHLTDDGEPHTG
jgi:glycosyltransferase involved in cell wall biosynthesis